MQAMHSKGRRHSFVGGLRVVEGLGQLVTRLVSFGLRSNQHLLPAAREIIQVISNPNAVEMVGDDNGRNAARRDLARLWE
jgi:hypothetical protein